MKSIRNALLLLLAVLASPVAFAQGQGSGGGAGAVPSWASVTQNGTYTATASFSSWCVTNSKVCTSGDQTDNLQKYYLDVQLLREQLNTSGFKWAEALPSGAGQFVRAYVEPYPRQIQAPIDVPEGVAADGNLMLYRNFSATITGPCAPNWWDGSVCGVESNIYQPTMVASWGSRVLNGNIYARNTTAANSGSGYSRRSWEVGAILSIGLGGSGYTNGETGYLANPTGATVSGLGGDGAQVTLTVVGGVIQSAVMVSSGATQGTRFDPRNGMYTLPPALQDYQYSRAAWIAATGYTTFLDDTSNGGSPIGCYKVVGQTSGASNGCIRVSWYPDWLFASGGGSGNSQFVGGTASTTYEGQYNGGAIAETGTTDNINVYGAGTNNDATYGAQFAIQNSIQNSNSIGQQTSLGGYYGMQEGGIDYRCNIANPVQMQIGLMFKNGQQHCNMVVVDSPAVGGVQLGGNGGTGGGIGSSINYLQVFVNGGNSVTYPAITGYAINAAGGSSGAGTLGLTIPMAEVSNVGNANAAVNVDWWYSGNYIYVDLPNFGAAGATVTNGATTKVANFGTNNLANGANCIYGQIDNSTSILYNGTIPSGFCFHVWDAVANGFMQGNGAYQTWSAGPPVNGGVTVNKAIAGSVDFDTTNGDGYLNQGSATSQAWTRFNAPAMPKWTTGHFYTIQGNSFTGTVNAGTTGGNIGATFIPIYVPNPITPTGLAYEIVTPQATGFNARLAVYADKGFGTVAPIIDTGTIAVAASAANVQIATSASWTTGNGTVLQPGMYWVFFEWQPITSLTFRSTNFGSPGPEGPAGLGYILSSGVASPSGPVVSKTITGLTTSIITPPTTFTPVDNASGATPYNAPIVWLGL